MATAAYNRWVTAGKPWRLASPIAILQRMASDAGVEVKGTIGDPSHLMDDKPEDHTPFPVNPWPVPLPGYFVCAIDLKDGPWSDRLLADAKAGRAPWIKYLNFRGKHYDVRDRWVPTPSRDTHLHASARSDYLTYTGIINPFEGEPMPDFTSADKNAWTQALRIAALVNGDETMDDLGRGPKATVAPNVALRILREDVAELIEAVKAIPKASLSPEAEQRIIDGITAKLLPAMTQAAFDGAQEAEKR